MENCILLYKQSQIPLKCPKKLMQAHIESKSSSQMINDVTSILFLKIRTIKKISKIATSSFKEVANQLSHKFKSFKSQVHNFINQGHFKDLTRLYPTKILIIILNQKFFKQIFREAMTKPFRSIKGQPRLDDDLQEL